MAGSVTDSPVFLAGDGGDEGALAAAHVADDAHQLARPHAAAHVLQHDALRRQTVAVVVHIRRRRRRRQRPVVGTAGLKSFVNSSFRFRGGRSY